MFPPIHDLTSSLHASCFPSLEFFFFLFIDSFDLEDPISCLISWDMSRCTPTERHSKLLPHDVSSTVYEWEIRKYWHLSIGKKNWIWTENRFIVHISIQIYKYNIYLFILFSKWQVRMSLMIWSWWLMLQMDFDLCIRKNSY